jgi:large subunit ribosomal protein L18
MYTNQLRRSRRARRKLSIRKKVMGTSERPRLAVFRSAKHIYAQLIDDTKGATLVQASTQAKDLRGQIAYGGNVAAAKEIGRLLAERARAKNIEAVAFDRAGYRYHGRVKSLADAAREAGLKF